MNGIRFPVTWQFTLVYLDDILVFLHSPHDHIVHMKQILSLLRVVEVSLKLRRRNFSTENIDCLGHVILSRRLETATHTRAATKGLKPPTNTTKLCTILGLRNVSRRFVYNFAWTAILLSNKLKKGKPKHFGELTAEKLRAMLELQEKLVLSPILPF